jgi:methyl-accepting chemotaxis protein
MSRGAPGDFDMHLGFTRSGRKASAERTDAATLAALSKSQAIIEFEPDGTILTANANFLSLLGYDLNEVVGQHHRMFVDAGYAKSAEYRMFWDGLRRGQFDSGEYRRLGKGSREIWIQASYNPVFNTKGELLKVVKIAADVTALKRASADAEGQLAAISKSQAVVEFNMAGEVLTANENFCAVLGYRLEEMVGRHHRMFVAADYAQSTAYHDFWERMRRGEYDAGEYARVGRGGKEVWIQGSYNPIFDLSGKPYKVVKYATDITARKTAVLVLGDALGKLAGGDLTTAIDGSFVGEFDDVRRAFNGTVAKFGSIMAQLRSASRSIKTATGEILSGANDLGGRTARQATAVEQTSAAVDRLMATVAENATRSESANGKTRSVAQTAEEAGKVIDDANRAMERISASSAKISSVIGIIDDIAFQTNLLALNASVEAARAGDAGKGFAVVAVEVRRLAQSAALASAEVKALIEQSAGEVRGGSSLVSDASQKVSSMLNGIRENRELVEAIARATQKQAETIAEVSTAVKEIDEMTQHNAALVQETNAAIEQTESQASELDQIVDVFVLQEVRQALVPVAATPATARHGLARKYLTKGNAAVQEEWNDF